MRFSKAAFMWQHICQNIYLYPLIGRSASSELKINISNLVTIGWRRFNQVNIEIVH